jgi:hypothetical protein
MGSGAGGLGHKKDGIKQRKFKGPVPEVDVTAKGPRGLLCHINARTLSRGLLAVACSPTICTHPRLNSVLSTNHCCPEWPGPQETGGCLSGVVELRELLEGVAAAGSWAVWMGVFSRSWMKPLVARGLTYKRARIVTGKIGAIAKTCCTCRRNLVRARPCCR